MFHIVVAERPTPGGEPASPTRSPQRHPQNRQLPDLRVQLFDLPLAHLLRVDAHARVERPRRVVQQLLLPSVNLIG